MAKLVSIDPDGAEEERDIPVNEEIIDQAEELGVPFGCTDGRCGSCRAEIVEGMDLLNERKQEELDMGLDDSETYRLLCQCRLKKEGLVKIRF